MLQPDAKPSSLGLPLTPGECCAQLETVLQRVRTTVQRLTQQQLLDVYRDHEVPFARVLAHMKRAGIGFEGSLYQHWIAQINCKVSASFDG